jgi:hypothetical protein
MGGRRGVRQLSAVAGAVAAVVLAAAVAAVLLWPDDEDPSGSAASRSTGSSTSAPDDPSTTTTSAATTATTSTAPPTTSPPPLSADSPVVISGIGAIRAGMTVEEASAAGRVDLVREDQAFPDCWFVVPAQGPAGVSFMVTGGTIGRVDVTLPGITTRSGVGVGSTQQEILATYPGQITVAPHAYGPGGHYLTFVPRDAADANLRMVFETDGRAVTSYRAGRRPDVEAIEGCA